ncbi:MAG: terminase [Xanthobacteraceae bacterium]|nr:terminase [Xanthobacteraceae bacterium]
MPPSLLDDISAALGVLPAHARESVAADALTATANFKWIPNPGPQTEGFFCAADETFYGGQAGGGKTDLGIGLAIAAHRRSLILRRINKDALKIVPRIEEILGTRTGYNGQLQRWKLSGRQIDIAGCEQESDKQRFKGDPHDLIVFDEGTDFLESQYRFIVGWNRSTEPGQRCRVLVTSNPPTTSEGLWVIRYWAPWLDSTHPKPAKPGELRWFTTINGEDTEVDGPGPHTIAGEKLPVTARSRTYLPASLADNPDLASTGYASVLAGLPEELRRAYRDGDFSVGLRDNRFQVIPTAWIVAAQSRWRPDGHKPFAMTAMGFDPAGGGSDSAELAWRHGGWYAPLISAKGEQTADGSASAATIIRYRRNNAPVIVDVGGGYGGAVTLRLKDNGIAHSGHNGAGATNARTRDGQLKFANKRAEAWWRFREELDPDQEGGSPIALPPDPELRADLAAPAYEVGPRGLLIESKDDIRKRLGRSPGKGDAVVMCLSQGNAAVRKQLQSATPMPATATRGFEHMKRKR